VAIVLLTKYEMPVVEISYEQITRSRVNVIYKSYCNTDSMIQLPALHVPFLISIHITAVDFLNGPLTSIVWEEISVLPAGHAGKCAPATL
jgi:hypothetical protein